MAWRKKRTRAKKKLVRPGGAGGMEGNWHLNLKNVGRCPVHGVTVELPCRECAATEYKRKKKLLAKLRAEDFARAQQ